MEYLSIFCIRIFSARCIHSYVGIIHIRFPGRNLQFPLSLLDTQAPLFFSIPIILRISQNARHTAFYRFPLNFPPPDFFMGFAGTRYCISYGIFIEKAEHLRHNKIIRSVIQE